MSDTLTLLSWNVNGIRAVHKKGFLDWLAQSKPNILCLQETRAEGTELPGELAHPDGYHCIWNASRRKRGYSGTALFSRVQPDDVQVGLGIERFDDEGRTIIARFSTFTLINCYFPNGGRDLSRVPYKLEFCEAFLDKCEQLRKQGQAVVFCGDVNTSHKEIDLAHPKANEKHTGFLPEERAWIDHMLQTGYIDTFRHWQPELAGQYTWWSTVTRSRDKNIGWRLDYFFVARELLDRVVDAFILPDVMGSDHCPVGLRLKV